MSFLLILCTIKEDPVAGADQGFVERGFICIMVCVGGSLC